MKRLPKVGDTVTIHAGLCEWDGVTGELIDISKRPYDDMPYMVQRADYSVWPFRLHEMELHSLDMDEEYGEG